MVLQRVHTNTSAISIVLLMSTCISTARVRQARAPLAATNLLEVDVLHAALARCAFAFGAGERGVLARVLQDLEAAALALVLVEVAAPHGSAARGDAFAAVADELQALRQRS